MTTATPRLATALLIAVGIIAVAIWKNNGRDEIAVAAVAPEEGAVGATMTPPELPRSLPSLRKPGFVEKDEAIELPATEEPEPVGEVQEPGFVQGRLYSLRGEVIPRGGVLFISGSPSTYPAVGCLANSDGDYRTELRPGPWSVYYTGLPSGDSEDQGWVLMGELQVLSRTEHTFDLYLQGDRVLSGGFWHAELDQLFIEIELRLAFDDSMLVAKASCGTSNAEYGEYLKALDEENPDVLPRQTLRPPGRGGFLLRGLAPDVYELRAFLDAEKKLFITGRADLRGGDVQFTPIKLVNQDFLSRRAFELANPH